jgi:hypothetical protein
LRRYRSGLGEREQIEPALISDDAVPNGIEQSEYQTNRVNSID